MFCFSPFAVLASICGPSLLRPDEGDEGPRGIRPGLPARSLQPTSRAHGPCHMTARLLPEPMRVTVLRSLGPGLWLEGQADRRPLALGGARRGPPL